MSAFNVWFAVSAAVRTAYRNKREQGDAYNGPMTDQAYRIIDRMIDSDVVEALYKSPSIGGKVYYLVSAYVPSENASAAQDAVDYMTSTYPDDFIKLGVWRWNGQRIGSMHAQAWRLMPDRVEYDSEGNVVNTIPASSNADLRDIALVYGQSPREF